MEKINIQDLWEREWKNAKRFFDYDGNLIKTKSAYKDRWYKEFKEMLIRVEATVTENIIKYKPQTANHIHCFNDVRTDGNYCTTCGIPQNKRAI